MANRVILMISAIGAIHVARTKGLSGGLEPINLGTGPIPNTHIPNISLDTSSPANCTHVVALCTTAVVVRQEGSWICLVLCLARIADATHNA